MIGVDSYIILALPISGGKKLNLSSVLVAHVFFNLQQKLQQNQGGRYWRRVEDSD